MNWKERKQEIINTYLHTPAILNGFESMLASQIIKQEKSMVAQLEADKAEILEAFCDLLVEAEGLYMHYPNNFRATAEEFFNYEIELRDKYTMESK